MAGRRLLAPGILVGSLIGAQIAGRLPTFWLSVVFAAFVGFSALQMLLDRKPQPTRELPKGAGMFSVGGAIGFISSLVGAGGGFISVPFMVWSNVKIHNAVATSAALGFPIAAAGTVGYVLAGHGEPGLPPGTVGFVYLPALLAIAAASVLTAPLGARVAHSLDTKPLKRMFAILLLRAGGLHGVQGRRGPVRTAAPARSDAANTAFPATAGRRIMARQRDGRIHMTASEQAISEIGDPMVRELATRGQVRTFPKNAVIINEGDRGDSLYIILTGKVKVYVSDDDGREMILDIYSPGDYVGEMALDGTSALRVGDDARADHLLGGHA